MKKGSWTSWITTYLAALLLVVAVVSAVLIVYWLIGVIIAAIVAEGTIAYVATALVTLVAAIPLAAKLYD